MNLASKIMHLVSDQNIYKIMDYDMLSDITDELMGALLIAGVLRDRLYMTIEFLQERTGWYVPLL